MINVRLQWVKYNGIFRETKLRDKKVKYNLKKKKRLYDGSAIWGLRGRVVSRDDLVGYP